MFIAVALTVLVVLLSFIWATVIEPRWIYINRQSLKLKGLPVAFEGLRLAFISDIHSGGWAKADYYRQAAQLIAQEQPDLMVWGGDNVVSQAGPDWADQLSQLAKCQPELGSFVIAGGHDRQFGRKKVQEVCQHLGLTWLDNQAVLLERQGQSLALIGLADNSDRPFQHNVAKAFSGLQAELCKIVVCHSPDIVRELPASTALTLCGHTHGGQVRAPFWGAIVHVTSLPYRCEMGQSFFAGQQLFVTKGLGSSIRLRFLCRPEVCVLTLHG